MLGGLLKSGWVKEGRGVGMKLGGLRMIVGGELVDGGVGVKRIEG